jgi:alpha-beta hydrolase superfamily lysophospholipase
VSIPLRDPALFTESPAAQEYVRHDPFTLRQITVRFALEDLKLNQLARHGPFRAARPALLMLAGRDRIVDNRRTESFFAALPGPDKTLFRYPDAAHTLEFDSERERYWQDLAAWLQSL